MASLNGVCYDGLEHYSLFERHLVRHTDLAMGNVAEENGSSSRTMPLWRVLALMGGMLLLITITGIFAGYRFFWNRSTAPTRVQTNLANAETVVKQAPRNAAAWVDLGYAQFEAGNLGEARKSYEQALRLAPQNQWIHYFSGLVEFQDKQFPKAEAAFLKVVKAYPDNPLAYYMLGQTYYEMGRYDQALIQANLILEKIDPTLADVYELRGQIFEKKGQKAQAIADYKQALRLDPARTLARERLLRLGESERNLPAPPAANPHGR